MNKTLYDKLWDDHEVINFDNDESLIYIDRHFLHEVTSPQAFEGLKQKSLKPWRIKSNVATPDHNVPTVRGNKFNTASIEDEISKIQVIELEKNCSEFDIHFHDINSNKQGIVHVIGPENGYTLPGMSIVCGDSHTSTHGAFATLAMGIGTSEVEHVLATQCLRIKKLRNLGIKLIGLPDPSITSKDVILYIIRTLGTDIGNGHAIEFFGDYIKSISMEARMTICNMSIEAGAKVGLIAYDSVTEKYLEERMSISNKDLQNALDYWETLKSDDGASYDDLIEIDISNLKPQISWGTSPEMTTDFDSSVPIIDSADPKNVTYKKAIDYMGLQEGQPISSLSFDKVFIGSCTNSRIEDLRLAAGIVDGKKLSPNIKEALVVPGSGMVKLQAQSEGLDKIFENAGFQWRDPGCSMCLGMNPDRLSPEERCASTSNRNFEGRQGTKGRTHLVSPLLAAKIAIHGSVPN